jgi:hypothetical protein
MAAVHKHLRRVERVLDASYAHTVTYQTLRDPYNLRDERGSVWALTQSHYILVVS